MNYRVYKKYKSSKTPFWGGMPFDTVFWSLSIYLNFPFTELRVEFYE